MALLTVILLTYNEEVHIQRALDSIGGIADEVYVVDSYSSDRTVDIAKAFGAKVLQNKFVNQAKQFQWALENCPVSTPWVMRLDADEVIDKGLGDKIRLELPLLPSDVAGVNLDRKHIFMGRWIRHGGRYPVRLLRIWRRGQGHMESRWMDEHIVVSGGRTVVFKGGFADHNLHDLTYFTTKHNQYATREAIEAINQKYCFFDRDSSFANGNASKQALAKRVLKERFYNRLPFTISAFGYFVWRYVFQLGFLDGRQGLIYHFLQGYWYRFLVGAKLMEFERAIAHLKDKDEIAAELTRLTGFDLVAERQRARL
ncbi:glycosyltransferase family 2 protein [Azoarcus sp. L1K30]|uniref:glycosyltransferase family 2 protein n=1 Tax=Azoarcus sp. L1K30 TaxID=2820277 RepID=UPI001B8226DE|nr:glycosyltransferase family 2 protein [Azoarcus sp. L1K30]MBR0564510.1 glycosyltransferase family 2 protein [Azoarcus sp. L1K30]